MIERRATQFVERVSLHLMWIAAVCAIVILIDPRLIIPVGSSGWTFALGGDGFSSELKGVIIGIIVGAGITGVSKYWLDASASSNAANKTMSTIAAASAPTAALAVAAARAEPLPPVAAAPMPEGGVSAKDVTVKAEGDVTVQKVPKTP